MRGVLFLLVCLWWEGAAAFFRNYVLRGGFRDGVPGLIVSAMNARYVGLKFAKLWELSAAAPRASRHD